MSFRYLAWVVTLQLTPRLAAVVMANRAAAKSPVSKAVRASSAHGGAAVVVRSAAAGRLRAVVADHVVVFLLNVGSESC